MAEIIRVLLATQAENNKPEDAYVNHLHFQVETTPPPPATLTAINSALQSLYNSVASSFTAKSVTSNVVTKYYNMADPLPRRPILTTGFGLGVLGTTAALPTECSMVLSFQASAVSGTPQARRRNRIYMPPMNTATLASPDGMFWSTSVVGTLSTAAAALLAASDAASDWTWVVRSETTSAVAPVANGWVDNAVDIQRRRGRGALVRDVFP